MSRRNKSRRLALGIGDHVGGGMVQPRRKPRCFKMMLHQPCDIGVVFQNKYGLAQTVCPRPAAVDFKDAEAARNH